MGVNVLTLNKYMIKFEIRCYLLFKNESQPFFKRVRMSTHMLKWSYSVKKLETSFKLMWAHSGSPSVNMLYEFLHGSEVIRWSLHCITMHGVVITQHVLRIKLPIQLQIRLQIELWIAGPNDIDNSDKLRLWSQSAIFKCSIVVCVCKKINHNWNFSQ